MKKKKNIRSTLPYDANGNLFSDFNKGLATIKYNILNLPDTVQHVNGHLLSNSYDATGDKFLAIHRTMNGSGVSMQAGWTYYNYPTGYTIASSTSRMYLDNSEYFSYNLDKILTDDGILVRTNDYSATTPVMGTNYFIRDHLGNVRVVFGDSGSIRQVNNYYPFGMEYGESAQTQSELNYQNYLYGGKELDRKFGINAYDFTGRYYDLTDNRFWSMDPMAEKYYSISPYAYCLNNPLKNVDPNGLDVWEINVQGELTNRIEDKTQDAFYMVTKNADGNYKRAQTTDDDGNTIDVGISFEYGTVTAVRTPTVNVKNSDGSTTPTKLTTFEMKGDKKATQLFEFMANPGIGTNVEWSHAKIGIERNERNIVGTSQERSSTAVGAYLRATGYSLRDVSHNHPSGIGRPSGVINTDGTRTGDLRGAELYKEKNKNTILNIYIYPSQYFEYNQNGLIIH